MIDEAAEFNDEDVPEAYWPDGDEDGAAAADPTLCEAGRNWLRAPVGNLQPGCDALGERLSGSWIHRWLRWQLVSSRQVQASRIQTAPDLRA